MTKKHKLDAQSSSAPDLRQRAEQRLHEENVTVANLSSDATQRLIHELRVHQVELEMQNDELRLTQAELESSRDQYSDLYDFAPVGYLTLSKEGVIEQVNLTLASWLGLYASRLVGRTFSDFVLAEDQDTVYFHYQTLVEHGALHHCDFRLIRADGTLFFVRLDSVLRADNQGQLHIRAAITDITERKAAIQAAVAAYEELEARVEERTSDLRVANEALTSSQERLRLALDLAETLVESIAQLNSSLNLDEVLKQILSSLQRVVPYDSASILLIEQGELRLTQISGYDMNEAEALFKSQRLSLEDVPHLDSMLANCAHEVVSSIPEGQYWLKSPVSERVRSYVCAPIVKDGELLGIINVESFTAGSLGEEAGNRIKVFVHQAALAIWNTYACLTQQELAALKERERIAMELHDAVNQTLWSAHLIADALPDLWEKDKQRASEKTQLLSRITRGTLNEMRTLLLEMRPGALEDTPLDQSLRSLVDAVRGQTELLIDLQTEGQDKLPPTVRKTCYRIVQEALNNACRHAGASQIQVSLKTNARQLLLTVDDDGQGFDPGSVLAGHYGLSIMQKRALEVGAQLSIRSTPQQGTSIQLRYDEID